MFAFFIKESRSEDSDEEDEEEESEPSVEPTIDTALEASSPPAPVVTASRPASPRSSTPESPKGTTNLCGCYVAQSCSRISHPTIESKVAFASRSSQTHPRLPVHP